MGSVVVCRVGSGRSGALGLADTLADERLDEVGADIRRLGVSRQTINAVETDKYDPSLPLALRMARLFGLEVRELFIDHWMPEDE